MEQLTIQADCAGVGYRRTGQHLDQGRLTGAVVAYDGDNLMVVQCEVNVVEGDDLSVSLAQAAGLKQRQISGMRGCGGAGWQIEHGSLLIPTVSVQRIDIPAERDFRPHEGSSGAGAEPG